MNVLGYCSRTAATVAIPIAAILAPDQASAQRDVHAEVAALAKLPVVDSTNLRRMVVHMAGKSGKLLARFVLPPRALRIPVLSKNLAFTSKLIPTVQEITGASKVGRFSMITMKSFGDKVAGSVGGYRVGYWPEEKGRLRSEAYENPVGFIEVTRENQFMRVSEHFSLHDFLTHDQANVWPKYVVLREPLLDKLELVIQDLERRGIHAAGMHVLSGFRTPHYNLELGDGSGRARDSRHQFGDAADVIIDSDGNGRMDDLNRDGRINFADVRVVLASVERVDRAYPDLVGGVGLYPSSGPAGPFAHIDVRGERARWVLRGKSSKGRRSRSRSAKSSRAKAKRVASARAASKR
ncbi:MAG TPA: hypothetical protein VES88_01725 [Gemmatimonadaceae bacterium]|nr:hypothetical protein [Gemmatimonadaceae bacterium]